MKICFGQFDFYRHIAGIHGLHFIEYYDGFGAIAGFLVIIKDQLVFREGIGGQAMLLVKFSESERNRKIGGEKLLQLFVDSNCLEIKTVLGKVLADSFKFGAGVINPSGLDQEFGKFLPHIYR